MLVVFLVFCTFNPDKMILNSPNCFNQDAIKTYFTSQKTTDTRKKRKPNIQKEQNRKMRRVHVSGHVDFHIHTFSE